ncbi:MAG: glutamyl-tRNA reductase [Blautia sp.]|nr:glutamyl-tRNA reductase [Blautia sp.]
MIKMIGTDHSLAPVSVRSSIFLTKDRIIELMEQLRHTLPAEGAVVISTCNRLEIWVSTDEAGEPVEEAASCEDPLLLLLCRLAGLRAEEYAPYFVKRTSEKAIRHLFYLACGLRSAILAEDQVLTQVKDALDFSREHQLSGSTMEVLFRTAVTAAKRIKTEVSFTRANSSAIEQAVLRLRDKGMSLDGKKCMVIGNGEYGRLAAVTLLSHGARVMMTLRQYHSQKAAPPQGCSSIPYDDRYQYLPECQVVVSATASPHCTLKKEPLSLCRPDHPIVFLDLAVPRDIEPEIRELPFCTLYDIDDFYTTDSGENAEAYRQAEEIIRKYIDEYALWERTRDLRPRIRGIEDGAVSSLSLRLKKTIKKLPLTEEQKEELLAQIGQSAGKVINKLIYDLQDHLPEEEFRDCIDGMEKIYHE